MDAAPDGEQSPLRHLGDFGRDIAAGVADAEHEYAPAGEGLRCAVAMRMHHLAAERRGARHVRVPRIPVMTVGNEHGCVPPGGLSPVAALSDRDVPAARAGRRDRDDLSPEPNMFAETKMIYEGVEILSDQFVTDIGRVAVRHGECGVLHALS